MAAEIVGVSSGSPDAIEPTEMVLSGSVSDSGASPLVGRKILVYREVDPELVLATTESAADGSFEILGLPVWTNDKLRVIAIGSEGENDAVFAGVLAVEV